MADSEAPTFGGLLLHKLETASFSKLLPWTSRQVVSVSPYCQPLSRAPRGRERHGDLGHTEMTSSTIT